MDIAEAHDWYDEQRAGLGGEFIAAIERSFGQICSFPKGYGVEYRQVRAAPLQRFPYVVRYRLLGEIIQVIAVTHARRHSREWRSRI